MIVISVPRRSIYASVSWCRGDGKASRRWRSAARSSLTTSRTAVLFFFSSRRRHTRSLRDWSSDVCSSDLILIDTGGLIENPTGIEAQMRAQTERAVAEADRLVFLADARAGLSPQDHFVARELRRSGKPVTLALNKTDGLDADIAGADFHALGLGEPLAISASHARGCEELMERVLAGFEPHAAADADSDAIRIAIIGRPNVGKPTLVSRLLGEERDSPAWTCRRSGGR